MGVRVEYTVTKLPESYVTLETQYAFEQDGDRKDKNGSPKMKMESKQVEVRGGYIIKVKGNPGHSFRVMNEEQANALKLSLKPRLINTETGEECNQQGIPLSVAAAVGHDDTGRIETDVDVSRNDDQLDLELDMSDKGEAAVGDAVANLE